MRKKYRGRPPKIRKTVKGKNVNKNKFFNLYSILGGLLFGDKKIEENVGNVGNVGNIVSAPSSNIGALKLDTALPEKEKESVPTYNTGGLVEVVKNYNTIVNEYITKRSFVPSTYPQSWKDAAKTKYQPFQQLSPEKLASIFAYTEDKTKIYQKVNQLLRTGDYSGEDKEDVKFFTENLQGALEELTNSKGETVELHRVISGDYADTISQLQPGDTFEEKGFGSWSQGEYNNPRGDQFLKKGETNVVLRTESNKGYDVSPISKYPRESEYIIAPVQKYSIQSINPDAIYSRKVGDVPKIDLKQFFSGGEISTESGKDIKGAGVDTQLIAAQPGEVVINKETVDKVGVDYFLNLNKRFGGEDSNKPKEADVQAASGGGIIESLRSYAVGGVVEDEEVIDSTVSKILGLGFADDFTKDELQTLLKEFLVKYQAGSTVTTEEERSKVDSGDLQRVKEEFIRLKKEKSAPEKRYRVTKRATRGTLTGFGGTPPVEPPGPPTTEPTSKMLPGVGQLIPQSFQEEREVETEKKKRKKPVDSLEKNVRAIRKTVDSIFKTLLDQNKFLSGIFDKERKAGENQRRAGKEERFESGKGEAKTKKVLDKVVKPFSNIFDKFLKFITTILLGKALIKLVDWFGNPDNQSKVESIGRFLKDFWPALLGAYLIFGNSLGGFVANIIGTVTKMTVRLLKFAIPKLINVIRKNPIAAAATAIIGGAAIGGIMQSQTPSNDPERAKEGKTQLEDTQDFGGTTGAPISGDMLGFAAGGLVPFKGDDSNLPEEQKGKQPQQGKQEKGNPLKGLGGAIDGASGGLLSKNMEMFSGIKGFLGDRGISTDALMEHPLVAKNMEMFSGIKGFLGDRGISTDALMEHPLVQKSSSGLEKGQEVLGNIKEKGLGNAAMDAAGGFFGNIKGFMDEKGITDTLIEHPLFKMGAFGLEKGQEVFGNIKGFMDEKGITDTLMEHPLAKMGMFGMDKFMNYGKDPARDITGESGTDITGAGVDTQLISAQPGDVVINKEAATAMGPNYFDTISSGSGEKVSGAGPDTQMIAARPGEIVINRETVNAVGADHFLGLNRLFGGPGANKPKTAEVQAASGGGYVLPAFSSGGMVGGESSYEPSEPSEDYKNEGDSPANQENIKLLEKRTEDLKEQEETVGDAAESTSAAPKTIEATIAREDAAVEAALAKENTATPDIRTPDKGTMPDMLGLGGLISGIGSMFGIGPQKQEETSGGGLVGAVNKVMGVIQNPLSIFGMFGGGGEKKITDGNKGTPTEQEQKDLDNLAAKKEKLKQSQQKLMGIETPKTPEKPAVDYDSMGIQELNSFLDPTKTGASMPQVFEAAKAARAQARAQGLPEEEVQRLGQVAAVKAKMSVPGYQGGGFLGGIVDTVSNVASNPLVQTAASFIPGAAPIMTGMNMATGLMSGNPMSMVGAASDMIPGLGGITSGLGGVFGFQGGGMIGPSWMPWNWGKLVDKGRDEATVGGNAFGFNARYKNVTDPAQRRMLGLPPIEGRMGGSFAGGIFENTGIDIPGGTADRQLIKAQPGEYMLPADTVTRLGGPKAIDSIVARTDSNSTAAKLGTISKPSMAVEQPVMSDGSDVTTLPPIISSSGGGADPVMGGGQQATAIPKVSVTSNSTRMNAKSMYGLVG